MIHLQDFKFIPIFIISLTLTGCANIPDLGALLPFREVATDDSAKSFDTSNSQWPTDHWWLAYKDNQLTNLIHESFSHSPDIETAAARLRRAWAMVGQSGSLLYPDISANGSLQETKQSYYNGVPADFVPHGFQDAALALINISYTLDFWGKNRDLLSAAVSEARAAQLQAAQARLSLATSIGEIYGNLIQSYAAFDAAQNARVIRTKTVALMKARLDYGLENTGAYQRQLAAQASTEAEIESLKEQIALNKNRLAFLSGRGPDRALQITRPKAERFQSFGLPKNVPAEFMGRRPEILAAKWIALAAAKRIDAAKADFYPNINLAASFGQQSLGLDFFTHQGAFMGGVGPAVSLPLFNGERLSGQYQEAAAHYEESVAQYNALIVKALNEIADAASSQKALQLREEKIKKMVAASERAYRVAMNRYKGGIATYLDVLTAEDALISSRRSRVDIKARGYILEIAMIRALGGGFYDQTSIEQIEKIEKIEQ